MSFLRPIFILAAVARAASEGAASENMGPAAFMWPPDRVWSADADNTEPCGSIASVGNRTDFPLTGGKLAFTAQDDSYDTKISVSYLSDPKSNTDFTPLITSLIAELDPGHTCISIPDQPSTIAPGTNATFQIKYTADFDRPENQTFYACADVTFVSAANFNEANILCFNATTDEDVPAPTDTGTPTGLPGHGESGPPLTTGGGSSDDVVEGGGSGGLSKGGIAGVVVGCVVGVALVVGLGLLWYRERERKKRLVREREAGHAVKWVDGTSSRGGDSVAGGERESIRMGNLSA